jgi:hypothetical protein
MSDRKVKEIGDRCHLPNQLAFAIALFSHLLEKPGKIRDAVSYIGDRSTKDFSGRHTKYFRQLLV